MKNKLVLTDSSFLISLAKADGLSILEIFKKQRGVLLVAPSSVYDECVTQGIKIGYPDGIFIKKMFDIKTVEIKHPELDSKLPVDEIVLRSAHLWNVSEILVDDELLLKKIVRNGLSARRSVDLFRDLTIEGLIEKSEYFNFLDRMAEKRRLSNDKKVYYKNEVKR